MRNGSYDKFPVVEIRDGGGQAWRGWPEVCCELLSAVDATSKPVLAIECYPGVFQKEIGEALRAGRPDIQLIDMRDALLSEDEIALADHRVAVPVYGEAESLNLGTAATVCLYASARSQQAP